MTPSRSNQYDVCIKLAMSLWNVRNCRWLQQLLHYWQSALLREIGLPSVEEPAFTNVHIDCNSSISATFRSVSSASPLVLQRSWQKATGEGLPCWVWERVEVGFVGWHIDVPLIFWICPCITLSSNSSINIWVDPGLNCIFVNAPPIPHACWIFVRGCWFHSGRDFAVRIDWVRL